MLKALLAKFVLDRINVKVTYKETVIFDHDLKTLLTSGASLIPDYQIKVEIKK